MAFFALSFEAQAQKKVAFRLKNTSSQQLEYRIMKGNEKVGSDKLDGKTTRDAQQVLGATVEIKCNGKWISVGTVREKGNLEISCK